MKNRSFIWLALSAFITLSQLGRAAETKPPTVAAILDRYVEKLGGQTALDKIKSRSGKGDFVGPDNPVPYSDYNLEGKKRAWSIEIPNASPMMRVINGEQGWSKDPDGTVKELEGTELARLKMDSAFRLHMNPKGQPGLAFEKSESKNGDTLHILKATGAGGGTDRFYFSEKTGLLVRFVSEWDSGSGTFEEAFEDYRAVDGVQYPFVRKAKFNEFEFTIKFADVKHNAPIDPSVFAKPKAE